uniref:uncharacterized protein LOC122580222 n=1 Tax=Erigeron canadensis TaxID=72917 RepID=UPI001CB8C86F|nr:uncharacterized protein LOC122580222 [Erigeron canadensis]
MMNKMLLNPKSAHKLLNLLPSIHTSLRFTSSSSSPSSPAITFHSHFHQFNSNKKTSELPLFSTSLKTPSSFYLSFAKYSTTTDNVSSEATHIDNPEDLSHSDSNDEVEPIDLWEEEDEAEPEIGDGADGGGVVLQNCHWGEKVLSIAQDVLKQFGDDIEIFSFKTSPNGYIYVRLDRLCNKYGCPSMEDIKSYSREYKKRLDEAGNVGDIPTDLALEVSSPGADRLLRVPDDLQRFKEMPMRVKYVEQENSRSLKEQILFLDSLEAESGNCVWRLADVKENRDPAAKGRPMSRKQKDWRLKLPYEMIEQVSLYLD